MSNNDSITRGQVCCSISLKISKILHASGWEENVTRMEEFITICTLASMRLSISTAQTCSITSELTEILNRYDELQGQSTITAERMAMYDMSEATLRNLCLGLEERMEKSGIQSAMHQTKIHFCRYAVNSLRRTGCYPTLESLSTPTPTTQRSRAPTRDPPSLQRWNATLNSSDGWNRRGSETIDPRGKSAGAAADVASSHDQILSAIGASPPYPLF